MIIYDLSAEFKTFVESTNVAAPLVVFSAFQYFPFNVEKPFVLKLSTSVLMLKYYV